MTSGDACPTDKEESYKIEIPYYEHRRLTLAGNGLSLKGNGKNLRKAENHLFIPYHSTIATKRNRPISPPSQEGDKGEVKNFLKKEVFTQETFMNHNGSQKSMKLYHPPLIPPIKGGKVPSPLVGEGQGEGYFRANTIEISSER